MSELPVLDIIEDDVDLVLGAVVSLVIFDVFVVLVVPRVDIESSLTVPNNPRWRISGVYREIILSLMLSHFLIIHRCISNYGSNKGVFLRGIFEFIIVCINTAPFDVPNISNFSSS